MCCHKKDFYLGNCHAYVRCVPTETPGYYRPCIYKCEPYTLIFDPNTGSCEYPNQAPPGLCVDTPLSTTDSGASDTTTEAMTTEEQTTEEQTTEEQTTEEQTTEETTTQKKTTTTTEEQTPTQITTEDNSTDDVTAPGEGDCEYTGQTFPYPGDCHMYYICLPDGSGGYDVEIFDCGTLVYDPNTGACVFPDPDDDLCQDE